MVDSIADCGLRIWCLAHLLRELKETARDSPDFASGAFYPRCRRLLRDMLALKREWHGLGDAA